MLVLFLLSQEVYDWIGVELKEPHFMLHRAGAGFIGDVCRHDEGLNGEETLLFIVRV